MGDLDDMQWLTRQIFSVAFAGKAKRLDTAKTSTPQALRLGWIQIRLEGMRG